MAAILVCTTLAQGAVLFGDDTVVLDGDTLKVGVVSVRLHGIDAPDAGQRCELPDGGRLSCGKAATERLSSLADGRGVRCDVRDVDAYGRLIAVYEAGGVNIGRALVAEGLAWAFVKYADDYLPLEQTARADGLGSGGTGRNPSRLGTTAGIGGRVQWRPRHGLGARSKAISGETTSEMLITTAACVQMLRRIARR